MAKLTNLAEITKAEFRNRPIQIRCIVSGKNTTPYTIPKMIKIRCTTQGCRCEYKKTTKLKLEAVDDKILYFIDTSSTSKFKRIREAFGIACKGFSVEEVESQNVLRIFISQPPGGLQRTKWVGERVAYFVGHDIGTNAAFILSGYQTPDPKTQTATWVFTSAKKTKTDVESFQLLPKMRSELRAFQQPEIESAGEVFEYLDDLYHTYALNVTRIYERFELHLAVDLVFHSALKFRLGTGRVTPAWLDAIVLGDTRCGKGHVAEGLCRYYGVGEVVSAENCTYAGLVGGVQQIDKHWVVTWGRIPVNDQGFVIIDEASNLSLHDWTRFSRIRSEGVAEVVKIQHQAVNARTRLLFLSNPPLKSMSSYSYGIEALPDLVHAPEDMARFDYAFIVTNKDVDLEDINTDWAQTKFRYPQELERMLIMWIWSRKPDQIKFTDAAVASTYRLSNNMGKKYDISIPLIQGENVRFKLGKIAIAFAGRMFNASKDGETLIVDELHVECAALFLRHIYKMVSNGYLEYSQQRKLENPEMIEKDIKAISTYFKAYQSPEAAFSYLLNNSTINTKEIRDFLGCSDNVATEVVSKLLQHHCIIKKGPNYYVKTPHFTDWLRQRVRDKRKP